MKSLQDFDVYLSCCDYVSELTKVKMHYTVENKVNNSWLNKVLIFSTIEDIMLTWYIWKSQYKEQTYSIFLANSIQRVV